MSTDGEILRNFLGSRDIYRRPASSYPVMPSHWQVRDQDGQPYQHQITGTSLTTRLFGRGRRGLLQSCAAPPRQVAMLNQLVGNIPTPTDGRPTTGGAAATAKAPCPSCNPRALPARAGAQGVAAVGRIGPTSQFQLTCCGLAEAHR